MSRISVDDYEIGCQKNFDYLAFYNSLNESKEKNESQEESEAKENHHSLFYPILKYCVNVLNSSDSQKLNDLKFKIGQDKNKDKIYVCVGRQMYDLFFVKKEGKIDDQIIDFKVGKNNFELMSASKVKDKIKKEKYKEYFDIPFDKKDNEIKNFIDNNARQLNITVEQLIKNKKKTIITTFLKGYAHQEEVLKSLEGEINGQFINLPNLIFKKKNEAGKTIEEIDQIYLIKLKDNKAKKVIKGFDVFYYADSSQVPIKTDMIKEGKPLELEDENLYFIEIKRSIIGLKNSYLRLQNDPIQINDNISSKASKYTRENLTEVGNTILTVNIFADLIKNLIGINHKINILYIVDNDFDIEMAYYFNKCLLRDENVMEKSFEYKIQLIYTQPDLFLMHYIETNKEKNKKINSLEETINQFKETMKNELKKYHENIKYIQERSIYTSRFHNIDDDVIDFCKGISNSKALITIGKMDRINDNHKYLFTSLKSVACFEETVKNKYFLFDFITFNYVNFKDINNDNLVDNAINSYLEDIGLCKNFDEVYLLVDFAFMSNFKKILKEGILESYSIKINMFEKYYFILYLKREDFLPVSEIKIIKNKCENPMFDNESENLNVNNVEEFINNYYNLILTRDFFTSCKEDIDYESAYLFDYQNRINYLLDLCIKPGANPHLKDKKDFKDVCHIEIISTKKEFNYYYDSNRTEIDDFVSSKNHKKIIFVRKNEFGKKFDEKRIESIIKYLFKFDELNVINEIGEDKNKIDIPNNFKKYGDNYLANIIEKNNILPILFQPDSEICQNIIPLIEYNYFLGIPLLLNKKLDKPKLLILANDFGLLNYYYSKLYLNTFKINCFMENNDNIISEKNFFKIDNTNIKIAKFIDVIDSRIKKINSNLDNYDLIILEYFKSCEVNKDMIPNIDIILQLQKLLNYDGILVFNLRAETFKKYNDILDRLKKKFKKVIEINLRICSGIIICCQDKAIKVEKYYKPEINFLLESKIENELCEKLAQIQAIN